MAFPANWRIRCKVTIQASEVPSTVSNFPCLIIEDNLPSMIFHATSGAQDDGGDIRFSSDQSGGTQLSLEVVTFDRSGSNCEMYVKIPSMSSSVDTDIWVWWDNVDTISQPASAGAYGAYDVWSDGYEAVYHMNGSGSLVNSANANNTLTRINSPTEVNGLHGKAQEFDAAGAFRTTSPTSAMVTASEASWEFFFKRTQLSVTSPAAGTPLSFKKNNQANACGFDITNPSVPSMGFKFRDVNGTVEGDYFTTGIGIDFNVWEFYLASVDDSTEGTIYKRSAADTQKVDDSGIIAGGLYVQSGTNEFRIGDMGFDCIIDEVRFHTKHRTASYVNTTYANRVNAVDFAVAGSPSREFDVYDNTVTDGLALGDSGSSGKLWMPVLPQWVNDCNQGQWEEDVTIDDQWIPPYVVTAVSVDDGFTFSDEVTGSFSYDPSASDGIDWGDTAVGVKSFELSASDGIIWGDSTTALVTFAAQVSDGFAIGDTITVSLTAVPAVADGFVWSDIAHPGHIYDLSVTDGFVFSDQISVATQVVINIIDGFVFSDEISPEVVFAVSISDGFVFGDVVVKVYDLSVTDGFVFGDSAEGVQLFKFKAYFTGLDKTFTFIVRPDSTTFVAKEDGLTFEADDLP